MLRSVFQLSGLKSLTHIRANKFFNLLALERRRVRSALDLFAPYQAPVSLFDLVRSKFILVL